MSQVQLKIESVLSFIVQNKMLLSLFFVFLIIYLIAWNRGLPLLYLIAELSLATLVLSLIAPYFNLLGISAQVNHPKQAQQGETIPIRIELESSGFFAKYFLELWWNVPFSEQTKHMFFITKLGKKQIINAELLCEIRGAHKTGPLMLQTGFPLGIKVFTKMFEESNDSVLVLPRTVQIHDFSFSADESSVLHGDNQSERKGGHDEFVSVREYKPGDSPRYIHWPTSARKGELMVREYQDTLSSSLVIMLDLHKDYNVGRGKETTLEYAITIAASLATYALDEGYRVSIFGYAKEKVKLVDIKGSHNIQMVLETLAYAKCDGDERYEDALSHFLSYHKRGGTLVLFDNGSETVEKKMDTYAAQFFKPVLFDIKASSFKKNAFYKDFSVVHQSRQSKYILEKGCDLERMFR